MLEGYFFKTANELFDKVTEILTSIPNYMFRNAYDEWPRRLQLVIDRDGAYVK